MPPERKKDPIAHWETLGFQDKHEWAAFQEFFTNYIAFNSNVMELLLSVGTLKAFPMVPVSNQAGPPEMLSEPIDSGREQDENDQTDMNEENQ